MHIQLHGCGNGCDAATALVAGGEDLHFAVGFAAVALMLSDNLHSSPLAMLFRQGLWFIILTLQCCSLACLLANQLWLASAQTSAGTEQCVRSQNCH